MSDTETIHAAKQPRADKVTTVAEIVSKLDSSLAVFVTEYRGLSVSQLATVRNALRPAEAEYAVYKNTLARLAIKDSGFAALEEYLVGPTGLTFVRGDVAAAAKAIRDSAKALPALVVKGGVLGGNAVSAADITAIADLPSREQLLAQFAGALQAPLVKTARLLQAVPAKFAYGLTALIDQQEQAAA
ncbi:MAG TPA: 50S ribosomal protein L10 [Ilumatobacter sp.]|nr:50S ribosomal protein L10 [Ilumatobacter sp.]